MSDTAYSGLVQSAFAPVLVPSNIFQMIRQERLDFLYNYIEVVPGFVFNHYDTIKKIHLYYNSHFVDGDYENLMGVKRKKVFHNINAWRCEVATKMLDIDTKDFILVGEDPSQDLNVFLLEKELKLWLKTHELGMTLNQIVEELPVYGTVVLEKVKGGARLLDLRFLYIDPTCENLDSARYINYKNYMSIAELRKMKGVWENVDEAIQKFRTSYSPQYDPLVGSVLRPTQGSPFVEVWRRYGEVPKSFFTDNPDDADVWVLARFDVAGVDNVSRTDAGQIIKEEGLVLHKEIIKELPLQEIHYTRTKGRWLGVGIVEKLFEEQRRINEIKNQKSKAMEVGALTILQTKSDSVANNILTDVESGYIMTVKDPITPVPTEMRDFSAFQKEEENIDTVADRKSFSYDTIRGEGTPATATLGAVQMQTAAASSSFDYKRENIGLALSKYIRNIVFPELVKDLDKEHILRFTGSLGDLNHIRDLAATTWARNTQIEQILSGGIPEDEDALKQRCMDELKKSGDKLWIKIQQGFASMMEKVDWYVDLVITGENRNMQAQINNAQAVLNLLAADPMALQDPSKKALVFKILTNLGFHSSEIEQLDRQSQTPEAQQASAAGAGPQGAGQLAQLKTIAGLDKLAPTQALNRPIANANGR